MIYHPHPIIHLGPINLKVWGLFFSLALAIGILWTYYRAPEKYRDQILNLGIINILAGVVGARLAYVLLYSQTINSAWDIFRFWEGGMVSYGGIILGVFLSIVYIKKAKLPLAQLADIFAPPLALGIAITRIGCFLNHCHLGKLTEMPWGIQYLGEIRHPIALYYALSTFIVLIILLLVERYRDLPAGSLGLLLLILYPLGRILADQFALYQPAWVGIINIILLVVVFLIGIFLFIRTQRQKS